MKLNSIIVKAKTFYINVFIFNEKIIKAFNYCGHSTSNIKS